MDISRIAFRLIMLLFPVLMTLTGTWNFVFVTILIFAVYGLGRKYPQATLGCLIAGYTLAFLTALTDGSDYRQIVLLPWAVLVWLKTLKPGANVRQQTLLCILFAACTAILPVANQLWEPPTAAFVAAGTAETVAMFDEFGLWDNMNLSEADEELVRQQIPNFVYNYYALTPGILGMLALLHMAFCLWFVQFFMRTPPIFVELNSFPVPVPALSLFALPWYSCWGLIGGLLLALAGSRLDSYVMFMTGICLLIIFAALTMAVGCGVIMFRMRTVMQPRYILIISVVLAFVFPPAFLLFIVVVGLIDYFANLRRLPEEMIYRWKTDII